MNIKTEKLKIDNYESNGVKKFNLEYFKDDNATPVKINELKNHAESKGYKVIKAEGSSYPIGLVCWK